MLQKDRGREEMRHLLGTDYMPDTVLGAHMKSPYTSLCIGFPAL